MATPAEHSADLMALCPATPRSRRAAPPLAGWGVLACSLGLAGCAAGASPASRSSVMPPAADHHAAHDHAVATPAPAYRALERAPRREAAFSVARAADGVNPLVPATSTEARCPPGMALIEDRYCIDRWEASVVVRRGSAEEAHSPYEPLDAVSAPYRAVTASGSVPQGYVSGTQAEAACRASGKRLCTANEWELACRGPSRARYPYGDQRRAGVCNDDVRAAHPVVEAARSLGVPAEQTWTIGMNLPLVNQLPEGLLAAGARTACTTPDGVQDLVGNLHEWIADPDGTFRGGFYMDTTQNGEGCAYQTTAHDVGYHDYSTGFRCCAHADPVE